MRWSRWWHRSTPDKRGTLTSPCAADDVRLGSQDILDQARWLYGIHSSRNNSAQQRAIAVMAFAGGVIALGPNLLPASPSAVAWVAFVIMMVSSVLTVVLAMSALIPRRTEAPANVEMRRLFRDHRRGSAPGDPVHQIVEMLLRTTAPGKDSFLELVSQEAEVRLGRVRHAYWSLSIALGAVTVLAVLTAIQS